MYTFINKSLNMTWGKAMAQAQHAAVESFRYTGENSNLTRLWYKGGHYAKVILQLPDTDAMRNAEIYLRERGFPCIPIIDEGHTEVAPLSYTALGVPLVDKNDPHVRATFEVFELYVEDEEPQERERTWLLNGEIPISHGFPTQSFDEDAWLRGAPDGVDSD